jgi:hypothetical protein
MKALTQRQAVSEVIEVFAELMGSESSGVLLREDAGGFDYQIKVGGFRFVAEYKTTSSPGVLSGSIDRLKGFMGIKKTGAVPVIIVPFMGEVGKAYCERAGVSWLDLSGNANIKAAGLKVRVEGRPNKYIERGRKVNLFAAKSSRVVRQLLLNPGKFQMQHELAGLTGLDDGYVSKIVRRLLDEEYLDVQNGGGVRPKDPNVLIDAWDERYDFDRHRVLKGHVSARSGEELLNRVAGEFAQRGLAYGVTGLAAAWHYSHYASFRLVTVYLKVLPPESSLTQMGFLEGAKGANLWLVLPEDEGVFHGSQDLSGIGCVSSVQTYLDLKGMPERSGDARIELRKKQLNWSADGG